jgi:hypothetical protein
MNRNSRNRWRILTAITLAGTIFQFGPCVNAVQFLRGVNPCGTILACDPTTFNFLTSGYSGPGVDPDIDPACTFPPFCDNDPFVFTPGG